MGCYNEKNGYIIIERHIIALLAKVIKASFFLFLAAVLIYYSTKYVDAIKDINSLNYVALFFILILVHYAFIKIILYVIMHYNNLIILYEDQIILIKSSLIMKDDMEIIDIYKIMKIDSYSRGLFSNILGFGNIVIEQQKNDVKNIGYVSNPHKLLNIFEKQRQIFKTKKYVQVQ